MIPMMPRVKESKNRGKIFSFLRRYTFFISYQYTNINSSLLVQLTD